MEQVCGEKQGELLLYRKGRASKSVWWSDVTDLMEIFIFAPVVKIVGPVLILFSGLTIFLISFSDISHC